MVASLRETKSEITSNVPSPRHADSSPQLGWDNDKQQLERKGTSGEVREMAWKEDGLQNMRNSLRSMSSEGESVDVSVGSVAAQLVYVHQLRERMSKDQTEMRSLIR